MIKLLTFTVLCLTFIPIFSTIVYTSFMSEEYLSGIISVPDILTTILFAWITCFYGV
jgi:hypothetical protein